MAVLYCGGCHNRSLESDVKEAAKRDEGPNTPHCPRCGTRITCGASTVEAWERMG
jgi:NAD-dependent SIR2 family protein deacetylase